MKFISSTLSFLQIENVVGNKKLKKEMLYSFAKNSASKGEI